jgi:nucleoside-diphosphate-sugar epimerase
MVMEDLSPSSGTFCVTGATGYISSYVVKLLLERGYTVRGTTRSTAPEKVAHLTTLPGAAERLKLFEADLLNEGAYDAAITGCIGVFHMASPFFLAGQTEEALIPPAVEGTKNVISSCIKLGVKKVVLTSSTAAVYVQYGAKPPEYVYTEADWSNEEAMRSHSFWYALSKQLAEKVAWSAVEGTDVSLVTMNPCLVVGPMLQPGLNTSCAAVLAYMNGSKKEVEASPKAIVDVRDVALAHVLGMEKGDYEGRTLLIGASFPWGDAKEWLADAVPECATGFPTAQEDRSTLPPPSEWAMGEAHRQLSVLASPSCVGRSSNGCTVVLLRRPAWRAHTVRLQQSRGPRDCVHKC